jgi:hypothetical protein
VNYSFGFRLVVGILIPLTIGWKILVPSHVEREMNGTLISFLTRNNFEIIAHDDLVDDDSWATEVPLIQARRRQCDIWIARLNSDGTNRQLIASHFSNVPLQFVVYQGEIYKEQPVYRTSTAFVLSRVLGQIGLIMKAAPSIVVYSSAYCDAENLPWTELRW